MFFRLVESLLIHIFNSGQRRRTARKEEKPAEGPRVAPSPEHVIIGHVLSATNPASDVIAIDLLSQGIVALTPQARKRHLYILGATGTGKTNLILRLIESDIKNKRAFCVIDLRGDLVDRILLRLADSSSGSPSLEEWRQRLLLLDLRDSDHVVGFNPLAGDTDPYNRAMHLLEVIKLQSDSFGVQLEETLRNSLVALAEAGWSLLEVEPLLTNAAFRKRVLESVSDSHVRNFFDRYDKLSEANKLTWSMAALNKITPLLAIPQLRLMFGQRSGFSFRSLLDHEPGMVILVSLALDRLHHAAHLVGGLLVSSFQSAMMARVDQPENERVPAFLYADEFELMATERFQEIVAEGRRFGVGLCLSHQNLTQLPPNLRNMLRNNVHTQLYFQTGATDAAELAKEITSEQTKDEVRTTLLTQNVGEAYLVRRGQSSLRLKTLHCPDPHIDMAQVEALKLIARETYAQPRVDIESELKRREEHIKSLNASPSATTSAAPVYQIRHAKTATFKPTQRPPSLPNSMDDDSVDNTSTNNDDTANEPSGNTPQRKTPKRKTTSRKPKQADGT